MAALVVLFTIPGCGSGKCSGGDGPGIDNALASAERWLHVSAVNGRADGTGTVQVDMRVVLVDVSRVETTERSKAIAIHSSFLPGIDDGLADQSDVFLAMASTGLEEEQVAYVVVRGADGTHGFVGECASEHEQFLRQRLGTRYDATIDAIIGMTGPKRIKGVLSSAGLG